MRERGDRIEQSNRARVFRAQHLRGESLDQNLSADWRGTVNDKEAAAPRAAQRRNCQAGGGRTYVTDRRR